MDELETDRILSEAQCAALAERIFGFRQGGGAARVRIISQWRGELRWGRNRVTLASDRQETRVQVRRTVHVASAEVETNQLEPAALEAAVRAAELRARYRPSRFEDLREPYLFKPEYLKPATWSEATYKLTADERARVARTFTELAEPQGLLSAGYLAAEAQAYAVITSEGQQLYARMTQGRCAMTVRDPKGTGSGWAGKTSYDWAKIAAPALGERAIQKCLASRDPVALEPGRYTVILEPQAVADLLDLLVSPYTGALHRDDNEARDNRPFRLKPGYSKLGLKVADERVTIGHDPMDPELGHMPFAERTDDREHAADPQRAVNWIENGVLTNLQYYRQHYRGRFTSYALTYLNENLGFPESYAFRMKGGETPVAEMIATTKRGLLVTRFSGVRRLSRGTLLATGLTRDGLWLIENGKITKPVKNFRFTDSPLFVLNSLEQLGPAEVVFRPGPDIRGSLLQPAVVPPLKARDFSFTALVDAV